MKSVRALIALAAWFSVGMSFAVIWAFTAHGMPPYWLTAVVGVATFAVVEVGGRVVGRRRR